MQVRLGPPSAFGCALFLQYLRCTTILTMAKKKYYVVWQGHKPGIYDNWATCQQQIKNYPQAKYKSFKSLDEAKEAYASSFNDYIGAGKKKTAAKKPPKGSDSPVIWNSLAVDAACSGNPGLMEYQGVDTTTGQRIFHLGPIADGTNNVGEFLALVHGLALLKQQNSPKPIYTDSRTAMAWVRKKKANTKLRRTARNKKLFELIARAEQWLSQNSYETDILKWDTDNWGEIPADFGRK